MDTQDSLRLEILLNIDLSLNFKITSTIITGLQKS